MFADGVTPGNGTSTSDDDEESTETPLRDRSKRTSKKIINLKKISTVVVTAVEEPLESNSTVIKDDEAVTIASTVIEVCFSVKYYLFKKKMFCIFFL